MNNSDYNDFNAWRNGDENDMNNPNNWIPKNGFFFYGTNNPAFRKMWENINKENDFIDNMKDYMNMNDILNGWAHEMKKHSNEKPNSKKPQKAKQKTQNFSQEDYLKLIEIRGYLAITEQFAHVKALDKLLNMITIVPKD